MIHETEERVVDKEYLSLLEEKLKILKDPRKATAKQYITDLANSRNHQLFKQLSVVPYEVSGFEEEFCVDSAITSNYFRKKIAPHTCAISRVELFQLVKNDQVQKQHEAISSPKKELKVIKRTGAEITDKEKIE
uniref:SWIB domain-containing protein n=1 Tax=Heterorhabditis bacteriophora TaxID=37862 RepID=A0A1I7XM89_HETBA